MTNEKAIENLEILLDSAKYNRSRSIVVPEVIEALQIAIESLKHNHMICPYCMNDFYVTEKIWHIDEKEGEAE